MKTEWMYFLAGAGLMAAVMTFSSKEYSTYDECMMVETQKMPSNNMDAQNMVGAVCQGNFPEDYREKMQAELKIQAEMDELIKQLEEDPWDFKEFIEEQKEGK